VAQELVLAAATATCLASKAEQFEDVLYLRKVALNQYVEVLACMKGQYESRYHRSVI
jgi:hypothetical protein